MRYTTFINNSVRRLAGALLMLLPLFALVCCEAVYDDPYAPVAVDANLRLVFAVPLDTKSVTTQSYDDPANKEGMDNVINPSDIEVYFFTEDGAYITSVSGSRNMDVSPYSSGAYDPHYHMYSVDMKVDGVTDGQRCRVVVVANRRSSHESALPFCTPVNNKWLDKGTASTDEEALYRSLQFNFNTPGPDAVTDYARWNWNKKMPGCVPMWGFNTLELKVVTKGADGSVGEIDPSGQIDMLRSIAKVRIEINPEILEHVKVTDYYSKSHSGGVRLVSSMTGGYMVPPYSKIKDLSQTPDILNKDREGGTPYGAYTDDWIRSGIPATGRPSVYPFFKGDDGNYYIYLPEHRIGQTWMQLEFEWLGEQFKNNPQIKDYTLNFADYPSTGAAKNEELDFFPVMRNHYYVYIIKNLSLTELRYEVCDWDARSTEIEFN